jgi:hypothetical protein
MTHDLLYLDYDGVLHPDAALRYRKAPSIRLAAPGHSLFESAPILLDALAPYPRVRVVLSTSWVPALGYKRARDWLPSSLATRVIVATFHSHMDKVRFSNQARGEQVLHDVGRRHPRRWIALDDATGGWHEHPAGELVLCRRRYRAFE